MSTPTLHALIVDENSADAVLMARALARSGYMVDWEWASSADALATALERRADWNLVLCDLVLPRLNIARTLAIVHDHLPRVPVVVVTARRLAGFEDLLASDAVSGIISKDDFADLPALVRSVLSHN